MTSPPGASSAMEKGQPQGPAESRATDIVFASAACVVVLPICWYALAFRDAQNQISKHLVSSLLSFTILFVPLWAFGFNAGSWLAGKLRSRVLRVLLPGALVAYYPVITMPANQFHPTTMAELLAMVIGIAALLEYSGVGRFRSQPLPSRELLALAVAGLPLQLRWHEQEFQGGSGVLLKLLLLDAALYGFLVIRKLENIGYDLRFRWRDAAVGLRELAFFAPIGILLAVASGFSRVHASLPAFSIAITFSMAIFFFVALPQELLFRGILQNLLERSFASPLALLVTASVFGCSHLNQGTAFNWRFSLLAAVAGIFYGRAWSQAHRIWPAALTHTAVNLIWAFWFL